MLKTNLLTLCCSVLFLICPLALEINLQAETTKTPVKCIDRLQSSIAINHYKCETEGTFMVSNELPSDQEVKETTGAKGRDVTVTWEPNPTNIILGDVDGCQRESHTFQAILSCLSDPDVRVRAGYVNFLLYPNLEDHVTFTDDACGPRVEIDCQEHNIRVQHALNDDIKDGANPDYSTVSGPGTVHFKVSTLAHSEVTGTSCSTILKSLDYNCPSSPPCPFNEDADNDGVCSNFDCDDNDPDVGAQMYGPCNDGNPETIDDRYADGCNCVGVTPEDCVVEVVEATITPDPNNPNCQTYFFEIQYTNDEIPETHALDIELTGLPDGLPTSLTSNNPSDMTIENLEDGIWNVGYAGPSNMELTVTYCVDNPSDFPEETCLVAPGCSENQFCYEATCDTDEDEDGVCADEDCDDNDPNAGAMQDPCTFCHFIDDDIGYVGYIAADGCTCLPDDCFDNGGDADCDGVCADVDCDDNDPNIGQNKAPCSSCTLLVNDMPQLGYIAADGCACLPNNCPNGEDADCDGACADEDCDDNDPTVGAAECTDTDCDGICAPLDCDDNDPTVPAPPGSSCDANGIPGAIANDGCTCNPILLAPCHGRGGDLDGDEHCADVDCDDNDRNAFPKPVNSRCNDNNPRTVQDRILSDGCTCKGRFLIKIGGGIKIEFPDFGLGGGISLIRPKQGNWTGEPTIQLYPNPAQHQLHVDWIGMNDTPVNMKVFNIYGQIMLEAETVVTSGDVLSLDISTLANGTYHMLVELEGQTRISKSFVVID